MNQVCAVVVTYNRKDLLIECVESLINQTYRTDILVVDNASNDGTEEAISQYVKNNKISYLNTQNNIGGAGGFNIGVKKAYEMGYDYIWLMDDDTIPNEDALEKLMNARDVLDGKFGYLSSVALWTDNTPCLMNLQTISDKLLFRRDLAEKNIYPISNATFVSYFISREIVKKIGLPQKEYFIWSDDTNYCLRINDKDVGYLVLDSIVVHKTKLNRKADIVSDPGDNFSRYSYAFRNRFNNARIEKKVPRYLAASVYHLFSVLFFSKNHKMKKMGALLKGVFEGFVFKPKVEYVD